MTNSQTNGRNGNRNGRVLRSNNGQHAKPEGYRNCGRSESLASSHFAVPDFLVSELLRAVTVQSIHKT